MELKRQRIDTLPNAIQAAECLGDYNLGTQNDRPQPSIRGGFNENHPSNGGPSKSGGYRSASKTKTPLSNSNSAASINNNQGRNPPSECRHCGGAHWNNECPNIKFNAHQTVEDELDASDISEEDQVGAFNAIVGSIPHALAGTSACPPKKTFVPITKKGKEKIDKRPPKQARTLMFIELKVNGKPLHALIDTGATHNCLASTQVERLGLVVQKSKGRVKAINSPPQTLGGTTTNVPVKLGPYKGSIDLCFGSTLSHNSDIHPPSDGQTDRFDDMLEEYLRNFATGSQKHWVKLLDAAQLCFNSQKSHHNNKSPFEIVTGQQPLLPQTQAHRTEGRMSPIQQLSSSSSSYGSEDGANSDHPDSPPPPSPSNSSSSTPPSKSPKPRFQRQKMLARKIVASEALRKVLNKRLKASQVKESLSLKSDSSSESESFQSVTEGDGHGSSGSE
uniref:Uncharacterized protein n=1 Tax=Nicotiana tabacum TaxID=4097 RepID=A0A1S4B4K3_TOBAC|nr:PREDICTED: uncharacterized protein LOC107804407 [Nicotiana tabacum]